MIKGILKTSDRLPARLVQHSHQYQLLNDRAASIQAWQLLAMYLDNHGLNTVELMESIAFSENGKPYFTKLQPQLFFNFSHSDNSVILAVSSNCQIGVDIEKVQPVDVDLLSDYFTDKEISFISKSNNKCLAFYTLWTKKEAFLKCIGAGMATLDLTEIEVLEDSISYQQQNYYFYPLCLTADMVGFVCIMPTA